MFSTGEDDDRETQDSTASRLPAAVMVTKHLPVNWMKFVLVAMVTAGVRKTKRVRENCSRLQRFQDLIFPKNHIVSFYCNISTLLL